MKLCARLFFQTDINPAALGKAGRGIQTQVAAVQRGNLEVQLNIVAGKQAARIDRLGAQQDAFAGIEQSLAGVNHLPKSGKLNRNQRQEQRRSKSCQDLIHRLPPRYAPADGGVASPARGPAQIVEFHTR